MKSQDLSKNISVLNKIKTESVHKGTGKSWNQWIALLEKSGARSWTHQEIVAHLVKKYHLSPWWRQLVATSYEIQIGRRIQGQNQKGLYSTVATKTFPLSQKKMWNFLSSDAGIAIWLKPMSPFLLALNEQFEIEGGIFGEVRTFKKFQRARLTWQDNEGPTKTIVQLSVLDRGKEKCMVVFQHEKLPSLAEKAAMLKKWKQVLVEISAAVS
jgi:hypothetical protein